MATRRWRAALVAGVSAACATGGVLALGPAAHAAPATRTAHVVFACAWEPPSGASPYGPAFTIGPELALRVEPGAAVGDKVELSVRIGEFSLPTDSGAHDLAYTGATLTASAAVGRSAAPDVTLAATGDGRAVGAGGAVAPGDFRQAYDLTEAGPHTFVVDNVTFTFADRTDGGSADLKCNAQSTAGSWPALMVSAASTPPAPSGPRTLQQGVQVSGSDDTSPTATGTPTSPTPTTGTPTTAAPTTSAPAGTTASGSDGGSLAPTGSGGSKVLAFALLAASLLLGGLAVILALPNRRRRLRSG
ncbi:hypothetical protein LO772_21445 [Yinghuangia sp. ASG 101]|uniref:hypothetical protein n=1 Tax=Yinghuangia sp. ASG 101 TaxID=2896848 RepID=UPI001E39758E|nr:hypothetical protein [Yinghuangia sp. ASG 101]UGQ09500.1 hypothetical protein LO772_21445 [Yinghuangia sp. ASG 101]